MDKSVNVPTTSPAARAARHSVALAGASDGVMPGAVADVAWKNGPAARRLVRMFHDAYSGSVGYMTDADVVDRVIAALRVFSGDAPELRAMHAGWLLFAGHVDRAVAALADAHDPASGVLRVMLHMARGDPEAGWLPLAHDILRCGDASAVRAMQEALAHAGIALDAGVAAPALSRQDLIRG